MNIRKYLVGLAVAVVPVVVAVTASTAVTAGPAQAPPQPVTGELVEYGTRAIGADATKAVDCPGLNTAGSVTRQAGMKETRSPEDLTAAMLKNLAVPERAQASAVYHAHRGGVEVQRDVVAVLDGRRVAVVVLTDLGDGLGLSFAIACVGQ